VYTLAEAQKKNGRSDVALFFAGTGQDVFSQEAVDSGVTVWRGELRNGLDFARLPGVISVFRKYSVHHFHALSVVPLLASILLPGKIRLFTMRGLPPASLRYRIKQSFVGFVLRRFFHGFSGNTLHATLCARECYGIPQERIFVTYNAVDLRRVVPNVTRTVMRERLRLSPQSFLVGTACKFKHFKRLEILINAFAKYLGKESEAFLLLLGDGELESAYRKLVASLRIERNVLFPGMRRDIFDYINALDVFVLPSNHIESFGNALVEAMALGVPSVVFADSPGLLEHVTDGESGFVVHNETELANLFRRLRGSPEMRERIGQAARDHVARRYSVENMLEGYETFYRNVLHGYC